MVLGVQQAVHTEAVRPACQAVAAEQYDGPAETALQHAATRLLHVHKLDDTSHAEGQTGSTLLEYRVARRPGHSC